MINGKVKEDFEKWLELQNVAPYKVMFYDIPKIVQHAYIIEWLDTVGININILNLNFQSWWYFQIRCIFPLTDYEEENLCKTRQEATEKAIEYAVEIYNATIKKAST